MEAASEQQPVLTPEKQLEGQANARAILGEWAAGMSAQELTEWIKSWWCDQIANREVYRQMRMRNQTRIMQALTREPDFEGLNEGYKIVEELRGEAHSGGIEDMSMEEVDAIIAECRREMQ